MGMRTKLERAYQLGYRDGAHDAQVAYLRQMGVGRAGKPAQDQDGDRDGGENRATQIPVSPLGASADDDDPAAPA